MIRRLIPWLCVAVGFVMLARSNVFSAGPAQDASNKANNWRITAYPSRFYNPDAGLGKVVAPAGQPSPVDFNNANLYNRTTTPLWQIWVPPCTPNCSGVPSGSAGANTRSRSTDFRAVGRDFCVGCAYGAAYQANVSSANAPGTGTDMYILYESTTDAGLAEELAHDGGRYAAFEGAK